MPYYGICSKDFFFFSKSANHSSINVFIGRTGTEEMLMLPMGENDSNIQNHV